MDSRAGAEFTAALHLPSCASLELVSTSPVRSLGGLGEASASHSPALCHQMLEVRQCRAGAHGRSGALVGTLGTLTTLPRFGNSVHLKCSWVQHGEGVENNRSKLLLTVGLDRWNSYTGIS